MKIYIDFDRTLFDCDKFAEDFYHLMEKNGIKKEDFCKYQSQFNKADFNPYRILDLMRKDKSVDKLIYQKIEEFVKGCSIYLFADTIPFLKYLKDKKYLVTILTRGNYDFQMSKIISSHIDIYCDDIIITTKHKGELDLDYANSIFIDDRLEEIKSIVSMKPKRMISIQRKHEILEDLNVETISSLNELINNI